MSNGISTPWTPGRAHRPGTSGAGACSPRDPGTSCYRLVLTIAFSFGIWVLLAAWSGVAQGDPLVPASSAVPAQCAPLPVDDPLQVDPAPSSLEPGSPGTTDVPPAPTACGDAPAPVVQPTVVPPAPVSAQVEPARSASTPAQEPTTGEEPDAAPPPQPPGQPAPASPVAVASPPTIADAPPAVTETAVTQTAPRDPADDDTAPTGTAAGLPADDDTAPGLPADDDTAPGLPADDDTAPGLPADDDTAPTDTAPLGPTPPVPAPGDLETVTASVADESGAPIVGSESTSGTGHAAGTTEARPGDLDRANDPPAGNRHGRASGGAPPAPTSMTATGTATGSGGQDSAPAAPAAPSAPVRLPTPFLPTHPTGPVGPGGPAGSSAAASSATSCHGAGQNDHSDGIEAVLDAQVLTSLAQAALRPFSGFAGSVVGGADDPGVSPG